MSPILFTVIYLLCIVMCLAVGMMLAWQLWSVAVAETAVENYDHEYYRSVASSRGEVCLSTQLAPDLVLHLSQTFQNSYDLGFALFPASSVVIPPTSLLQEIKEPRTLFQYRNRWIVRTHLPLPVLRLMLSSPIYTLFLPLRVPPYTDGRSWARRAGMERHRGVHLGEELMDDEDS